MAMNRYTPFGDLVSFRDAVNGMFEDGFTTSNGRGQALSMPLDVSETSNGFVVELAVPGVKSEDIDITLQDNVLTISGEVRQTQNGNEKPNYHRVERRYGRFARSISLPTQIDSNAVKANLEHGVLRLELPKAEAVKPRKISVSAGQNSIEAKPVEVNNEQGKEKTA